MNDLQSKASAALKAAALNEAAKNYLLREPVLFSLLLKGARRYIGGENLEEAVQTAKRLNGEGFPVSLEFMGESVGSKSEAEEATREFLRIIEFIKTDELKSIVSLDLSHIGLALDSELAYKNLKILVEAAANENIEVMISAEGIDRTEQILETFCRISPDFSNVGITLQAYLHRTPNDLERLLKVTQGKIRVVKGAFAAPREHILERGEKLDERYIKLVEILLLSGRQCSIATHHDKIQQRIKEFIKGHGFSKENYEFEMLYGIREDLLRKLKQEKYPCRQYIVYGKEWYLYLCNRIAENPDNLFQFVVDVMSS